jgi:enamine deaminase RidA (YjgF/YER057c/UK114 family)
MTTHDDRATDLMIEFSEPATPAAHTAHVVIAGKLAYISGALPIQDARISNRGQIGSEVALVDKSRTMARQALVTALSALRAELGGSLNSVKQVVHMTGHIACAPEFRDHDKVFDRASELLTNIFGPAGRHTRSLIGVASLPKGAPVTVDLVVALK